MCCKQIIFLFLLLPLLLGSCKSNRNPKEESCKLVDSSKNLVASNINNSHSNNEVYLNKLYVASDSQLYKNYLIAVNNFSTIGYFVVVKVKNINTGEVREVCTKGNFLSGAIALENKLDYDTEGMTANTNIAKNNFKRYFEFKKKESLYNIGYDDYSIAELNNLAKQINFDSLSTLILKTKSWSMRLDDKTMVMYAHELFDRGILTGENSCWGGTLTYIDLSKNK